MKHLQKKNGNFCINLILDFPVNSTLLRGDNMFIWKIHIWSFSVTVKHFPPVSEAGVQFLIDVRIPTSDIPQSHILLHTLYQCQRPEFEPSQMCWFSKLINLSHFEDWRNRIIYLLISNPRSYIWHIKPASYLKYFLLMGRIGFDDQAKADGQGKTVRPFPLRIILWDNLRTPNTPFDFLSCKNKSCKY